MYNDRFKKFLQLIFKITYLEQSSWTDDAQQNYQWLEGRLSFLRLKK